MRLIFILIFILPGLLIAQRRENAPKMRNQRHEDSKWGIERLKESYELFNSGKIEVAQDKVELAKDILTSTLGRKSAEVGSCWYLIGAIHGHNQRKEKAVEAWNKALDIWGTVGTKSFEMVKAYENIGKGYIHFREYDKAIICYKRALDVLDKVSNMHDPLIIEYRKTLVNAYSKLNNSEETIGKLERIPKAEEKHLVDLDYYYLGLKSQKSGEYEVAISYYEDALAILSRNHSDTLSIMANIYDNLGDAYSNLGEYNEAIEYYKKALDFCLNIFGLESEEVAQRYIHLGNVYKVLGRYETAIEYHEMALDIYIVKEVNRFTIANAFNNLGVDYYEFGLYKEAKEYYEMALDILKRKGKAEIYLANTYNNLGNLCCAEGKYAEAIDYHEMVLDIYSITYGDTDLDLAVAYNNLGIAYYESGKYNDAVIYYTKTVELYSKLSTNVRPQMAKVYSDLGNLYNLLGKSGESIKYHEAALKIGLELFGKSHPIISNAYNNLGNVYESIGQYEKATFFYNKALLFYKKGQNNIHPKVAEIYNNLGNVFRQQEKYEKSIEYYKKAEQVNLEIFGEYNTHVANSRNNLGDAYNSFGRYDDAIRFYNAALGIYEELLDEYHPSKANIYRSLGIIYANKGEFDIAEQYIDDAIYAYMATLGFEHPKVAEAYNDLSYIFFKQAWYNRAIKYFKKSLDILNYSDIENLDDVSSVALLMKTFQLMGYVYEEKYLIHKDVVDLYESKHNIQNALIALDYQSQLIGNYSKAQLTKTAFEIYDLAITTNSLLYQVTDSIEYLHEAFTYAENSKAYQLYETIQESDALKYTNIADSLLVQESDLRMVITFFEKQRQEKVTSRFEKIDTTLSKVKTDSIRLDIETDSTILAISGKLFHLRQDYENLKTLFEKEYPEYYRLKYNLTTVNVQQVQTTLIDSTQTLLEYFVGDSSIYVFVINKNDFHFHQIKKDFPLEEWIQTLRDANSTEKYDTMLLNLKQTAHDLYQKLVAPVAAQLKEKIIIIPDGVLGYLPFETLLVESPQDIFNWKGHHYLLKDKQISYCYSATLLKEMKDKVYQKKVKKGVLAFAPFYDGDTTLLAGLFPYDNLGERAALNPLPSSGEEVYGIQKIIGGKVFYHDVATEGQFSKLAGDYKILHLATHGKADDRVGDYSYLVFTEQKDTIENELLYVRDLYNLKLNAEMVVLSACETGVGELQKGEGIISLARGFTYAGTKSIITSLWRVDDGATKDLMLGFYRNLYEEKMTKDAALRKAKLDYLTGVADDVKAHPYFWSGFIGIGDMSSISF